MRDWNFHNIEGGFNSHVREQLPWYDLVSDMLSFMVQSYAGKNATVYDIGASTGNLKRLLSDKIQDRNIKYITIDNESNMNPDICMDATDVEYDKFDVAVLNLTLMFLPPKNRQILLEKLRNSMNYGGCIIVVDKFIQPRDYISTVLRRLTIHWKFKNEVPCEDIVNKELSLVGIQIPTYVSEFDNFNSVHQFFKFGEFEGYILTDFMENN